MDTASYVTEHCIPLKDLATEIKAGSFGSITLEQWSFALVKGKTKVVITYHKQDSILTEKMYIRATKHQGKVFVDKRSVEHQKQIITGTLTDEIDELNKELRTMDCVDPTQ